MRRGFALLFVLACASCQLFLSFGDEAAPPVVDSGSRDTSDDGGGADAAFDVVRDDAAETGGDAAPKDATPPTPSPCVPDAGDGVCPPVGAQTTCDAGKLWQGHCYFATGGLTTISNANNECTGAGAHLATFTCADEWLAVAQSGVIASNSFWIGATKTSNCSWTDGEPWTYAAWQQGQPDNVYPDIKVTTGGWSTGPGGSNNARALCERE